MQVNGKKIRELRKSLGLTQIKFARAIGIQQSYLSLVENRYCSNMSEPVVRLIGIKFGGSEIARQTIKPAEAVEIEIDNIFNGEDVYRDEPIQQKGCRETRPPYH